MKENLTYAEIEDILKKAVECAEYYQKEFFNNKVFTLYLANGERVKYSISPVNLPHLLGINIYNLRGIINLNGEDTLSMLKDLQARSYELYNKFRIGILKQEDVFSNYVNEKLENFKYNIKIDIPSNLSETQFVCHYRSEKSWEVTTKNQKFDYVIVKKLSNGKNALLCLKKEGNHCVVMSNQIPDSEEKFNEILAELITNQEITMLTGMEIYSKFNDSKYNRNLLPNERILKSRKLSKYYREYNCYINISQEYEYTVDRIGMNSEERYENKNVIEDIINAISNGKLISINDYQNSILINLINSWNDHICRVSSKNSDEAQISYTEAISELTKFRNLVTTLEEENRRLQTEANQLIDTNAILIKENDEQKSVINQIYGIIKPRIN